MVMTVLAVGELPLPLPRRTTPLAVTLRVPLTV